MYLITAKDFFKEIADSIEDAFYQSLDWRGKPRKGLQIYEINLGQKIEINPNYEIKALTKKKTKNKRRK